jgi:hypothetical protein
MNANIWLHIILKLNIHFYQHELKGTLAYLDCRIQGLYTPLVALIRYYLQIKFEEKSKR